MGEDLSRGFTVVLLRGRYDFFRCRTSGKDRRFRIWIRPSILIGIAVAILAAVLASCIEFAVAGLPHVPPVPQIYPNNFAGPQGFPLWVRYCHFFNFLFVMMLIRSGLSILVDHPRLYFNDDCTPESEWIRFTPLKVPRDRIWTAKDDARYISPIIGTPGYTWNRGGHLGRTLGPVGTKFFGIGIRTCAPPCKSLEIDSIIPV